MSWPNLNSRTSDHRFNTPTHSLPFANFAYEIVDFLTISMPDSVGFKLGTRKYEVPRTEKGLK
jgi:hypothetical protein